MKLIANYKELPNNPILQHNEMVHNNTEKFQKENLLLKKNSEGVKIFNAKMPKH